MLQNALWMFICFQHRIKGEWELTFHEEKKQNLHQGKRLVIFMCLNKFFHDCGSRTLETRYWKFDTFDRELNSDQDEKCLGMRCQQSLVASWKAFFVQAISCCTLWSEDSDASICNMAVGPCSFRPRTTHGNNEDKRNTYFTKLHHPGQFLKHWGHYCCY